MKGHEQRSIMILLAIALLLACPVEACQTSLILRGYDVPWLAVGAYAEYRPSSDTSVQMVITYNTSLDVTNATMWKNGGYDELRTIHPGSGEIFAYRWEITAIAAPNITLHVLANITNWMVSEFDIIVDSETGHTYASDLIMGYSRLWFSSIGQQLPRPVASNPAISIGGDVSSDAGLLITIQGMQQAVWLSAEEEDYRPPLHGSRTPYSTSLSFDSDTGLLLTCAKWYLLPFPPEARLICFLGMLTLVATNIDLGPPVPDPASILPGLLTLGVMVGLILVLTAVFYHGFSRKKPHRRRVTKSNARV